MRLLNLALLMSMSLFMPLTGCDEPADVPAVAETLPPAAVVYEEPVPERDAVDDDWFENTAMIGHSLMQGMRYYSGLDEPDYYSLTGASVNQLLSSSEVILPSGATGRLSSALSGKTYERVYLFMGINEISGELSTLKSDYQRLIDLVRQYSPDADIYVMAVLPVTQRKASGGTFTLERITAYNEMLLELCGEQECYYVNVYECFANDSGYLPSSASPDGVHLEEDQYTILADYLKTHTIEK